MALRVAIVGPGRVGQALGRAWVRAGVHLLGFVGRRPGSGGAAALFAGAGRELSFGDLSTCHAIVFAVGDPHLQAAVDAAVAAGPPRPCSLWLHTSGRHGLEVFAAAAAAGARRGALHPVVPFPSAEAGHDALPGAPAVFEGDVRSGRLLRRLAHLLGMQPIPMSGGDRMLYHAACALAANGLVALRSFAEAAFAAAGGLAAPDARRIAGALMTAALRTSGEFGPALALSGPVLRGDAATVAGHLAALQAAVPAAGAAYRALMLGAVALAEARGLDAAAAARLGAALRAPGPAG